ncbi:hypothetical protein AB1Y20_007885 [Prymnesium parvum]|uniref:Uncharacterized protein n=1 Tax=Prymnesium parvum TaxID=97485 RepID=A0AB34IV39_PRYPA
MGEKVPKEEQSAAAAARASARKPRIPRRVLLIAVATFLLALLGTIPQLHLLRQAARRREDSSRAHGSFASDLPHLSQCTSRWRAPGASVRTSLLVACSNRSASLRAVLGSWLEVKGMDEVVIVDWGSSPPLRDDLPASLDPRVRLVVAPLESEWNLARAYNLAASLASGAVLLKVDADTYLHPGFLASHALPSGWRAFFAGDWRLAPDENAWHLNGVLLVHKVHFDAVRGYDERMRHYGLDDTDLYYRLTTSLNLSRRCVNFTQLEHRAEGHAQRGETWVHEFMHRRAVEQIWWRWDRSGFSPSQWGVIDHRTAGAAEGICIVRCVSRPPFFEELAPDDLMAVEWRHAYSSAIHKAAPLVPSSLLQKVSNLEDYRTLMRLYEDLALRARYLAVLLQGPLSQRMLHLCAARALAHAMSLELLVVWSPDDELQAPFSSLFDVQAVKAHKHPFLVLSYFDPELFPRPIWKVPAPDVNKSDSATINRTGSENWQSNSRHMNASASPNATALCSTSSTSVAEANRCGTASNGTGILLTGAAAFECWAQVLRESEELALRRAASSGPCAAEASAIPPNLTKPTEEASSRANGDRREAWSSCMAHLHASLPVRQLVRRWEPSTAAGVGVYHCSLRRGHWAFASQCSDESLLRALASLTRSHPDAPLLLVLQRAERWHELSGRLSHALSSASRVASPSWLNATNALHRERVARFCTTRRARSEARCAQIEMAELLLLSRSRVFVNSNGCAGVRPDSRAPVIGAALVSFLLDPDVTRYTSCGAQPAPSDSFRERPELAELEQVLRPLPPGWEMDAISALPSNSEQEKAQTQALRPQRQEDDLNAVAMRLDGSSAKEAARQLDGQSMSSAEFARRGFAEQGVQVQLIHTREVDSRLPKALLNSRLVYVLQNDSTIASLARKIQVQLSTAHVPKLLAQPSGVVLNNKLVLAEAFRKHANHEQGKLYVKATWDFKWPRAD